MTQIGYVCKSCGSTILEEKVELLIDTEISAKNKEIEENNRKASIEYEEQKRELSLISKKLEILHKNKYPKYSFESNNISCSLHNGKTWHTFKSDEANDFIVYTQLYNSKEDKKPAAYFILSPHIKHIDEDRYVVCPLCNAKNYLPLKQLCLR